MPALTDTSARMPSSLATNRNFHLLWAGEGVSVLGAMTTTVVLPLLAVTEFDAGPGWMGLLTAAAWLPWLVLGLPAGAWIDRLDPRRVMITADLVAAAVIGSVPAAYLTNALTLPHLLLAALGSGGSAVFFRTAYGAFVPRVVRDGDLDVANGRLYGTESAMQVAGPGLGGLLAQFAGAALAVLADVVSFLVSAACLWRIDPNRLRAAADRPAREDLTREIAAGVRVVAGDRFLRFFTLQGGASNFALTGYGALLVLFMVRDLQLSAATVGLLTAVGSIGGLLGAAIARPLSTRLGSARAMRRLQVFGGPAALLIPLATPGPAVSLVPLGVACVGIGVVGANVIRSAFRQRYTPPHLLGRTMSASAFVNFGTMPLGGLAAGVLGSAMGVRPTIALMAALHVIASLAVHAGPYASGRDLPTGRLDQTNQPRGTTGP